MAAKSKTELLGITQKEFAKLEGLFDSLGGEIVFAQGQ